MAPIYVGKAGYQSLTHAITLGAVGSQAANKKAVLIVSPQWFKENGVKSTAFEAAFQKKNILHCWKSGYQSGNQRLYQWQTAKYHGR